MPQAHHFEAIQSEGNEQIMSERQKEKTALVEVVEGMEVNGRQWFVCHQKHSLTKLALMVRVMGSKAQAYNIDQCAIDAISSWQTALLAREAHFNNQ